MAVGTGTFMSALNGSVANTVLPVLTHALHGTVAPVEWVVCVYLLVPSALLNAGRWGDLHGHKPMYLTCVGLKALVFWERRTPSPMLDFGLFQNRTFSAASVSLLLNFVSLNGLLFLLPFYLISGRGLSAAQAGVVIAALPISMALVAPGSGDAAALADWASHRPGRDCRRAGTKFIFGKSGVGIGIFLSPNNGALMGSTRSDQQEIASGIRAAARNLGNVLGIGIVGAVFNSALAHHRPNASLFPAVHAGLLAVCLAACLGAFASAVRGSVAGGGSARYTLLLMRWA